MALARWQATIVDDAGNVQPLASIEVRRDIPGQPLVSLYSDRDGLVPIGNPFLADADGFAAFHVAGGAYKITATLGGFSQTWRYFGIGTSSEFDLNFDGSILEIASFWPQEVEALIEDRDQYDAGPVFDELGRRLSVLIIQDATNTDDDSPPNPLPTLYFLRSIGPAVWSPGFTFNVQVTETVRFDFIGDGTTTAFDIGAIIQNAKHIFWYEDGIRQREVDDFTVSGSVVTRTSPPADEAVIWGYLFEFSDITGIGEVLDQKISRAGDTMTGALVLAGNAVNALEAVPKQQLDAAIMDTVVGLFDDRGSFDASVNTFPASGGSGSAGSILKGDIWLVSVAGTLGGVAVEVGDQVRALVDTPGQTAGNWALSQANIVGAVTLNATQTLTNKTLTAPVINSPTGIVKGDVGLGSVDNTADTAKPVSTAQQTALDLKVSGPASATDNAVTRYDGTTGKLVQNSGVTIDDGNNVVVPGGGIIGARNAGNGAVDLWAAASFNALKWYGANPFVITNDPTVGNSGNGSIGDIYASFSLGITTFYNPQHFQFKVTGGVTQPLWDFVDDNIWTPGPGNTSTGGAMRFRARVSDGEIELGGVINGGFSDSTAAALIGDIDFLVYGTGAVVQAGFALNGDPANPGILPINGSTYYIGAATNKWARGYFDIMPALVAADITDPTKRFAFDVSGITPGTTKTWFLLNTTGDTFVGAAAAQTLTNKSIAASQLTGALQAGQEPAHTGDVTNPAGSLALTIAAGAVTLAKMANMATASLIYRKTAGTGAPEIQTLATLKTDLSLTGTNSGDQTVPAAASAAEQETGTEAGKYVAPATQHRHPSAVKAALHTIYTAGVPAITTKYNVSSITDDGVGQMNVLIATDFTGYFQIGSSIQMSAAGQTIDTITPSATEVIFKCYSSLFVLADPVGFSFVATGDQA